MIEHINTETKEYRTGTYRDCDNLWVIASVVYGDGNRWQDLIEINKEKYPEITKKNKTDMLPSNWKLTY